jgi:putative transposase
VYHVTSRGNRQQPIFVDDRDRHFFLGLLATICGRRRWSCRGYCLMTNHYHLVMETPDADLSAGMQALNGEYAHYFNFVHGTVGHVFQARFHAVLVESDPHLAELSRYLALNPVRAGLARAARDWRWSSYPAIAEDRSSPTSSTSRQSSASSVVTTSERERRSSGSSRTADRRFRTRSGEPCRCLTPAWLPRTWRG